MYVSLFCYRDLCWLRFLGCADALLGMTDWAWNDTYGFNGWVAFLWRGRCRGARRKERTRLLTTPLISLTRNHLPWQVEVARAWASPCHIYSVGFRRYVCPANAIYFDNIKMRYNLAYTRLRYAINPLALRRAYHLPQANIAPKGNIANPVRDLYRGVPSPAEESTPTIAYFPPFKKFFRELVTFGINVI